MITRRLLRVKALKLLFCHSGSAELQMETIDKELLQSIGKTNDLYYFLLSSVESLATYAEERIDIALKKFRPTYEEAHPNRKFIENEIVKLISDSRTLAKYCETNHLSWGGTNESIIRAMYTNMIKRDYYKEYMATEARSFEEDRNFLKNFFMHEFEDNQELETMLEESSTWWTTDELNYALGAILRTLDFLKPNKSDRGLFPKNKHAQEDEDFAKRLLRHSLIHYSAYWDKAIPFVKNWEADRVAAMDIMLIVQGFSEAVEFPEIPIKITINEYVEIAKYYSTPNSHIFVNGVLDHLIKAGIAEGVVVKKNLGLVDFPATKPKE